MRYLATTLIILIILTFSSCYSSPTPVIIRDIPRATITAEMSTDEYIYESTRWAIEIRAWIDEIIVQIQNKVPYIDLRKTNDTDKKQE